jgi:hypothetical protein
VLVSLTLFYLIFTRTWFFQAGLFGTMITKFRSFVIVFVVNLILLVTVRFWRLVRTSSYLSYNIKFAVIQAKTFTEIWDMTAYYPLYIIYRLRNKVTSNHFLTVTSNAYLLCKCYPSLLQSLSIQSLQCNSRRHSTRTSQYFKIKFVHKIYLL